MQFTSADAFERYVMADHCRRRDAEVCWLARQPWLFRRDYLQVVEQKRGAATAGALSALVEARL